MNYFPGTKFTNKRLFSSLRWYQKWEGQIFTTDLGL
jgi:hypothetical protein